MEKVYQDDASQGNQGATYFHIKRKGSDSRSITRTMYPASITIANYQ